MKLTIEHLAAYLPYGLKIIWNDSKDIYGITYENEADYQKKMYPLSTLIFTMGRRGDLEWKPILLPLSDLTKEIDVNGERFVPIDKINEFAPLGKWFGFSLEVDSLGKVGYRTPESWLSPLDHIIFLNKLFEWHFDCFGLIDVNLAIDKNTLNK